MSYEEACKNMKEDAQKAFSKLEPPTEKQEAWRHTAIDKISLDITPNQEPTITIKNDNPNIIALPLIEFAQKHPDQFDFCLGKNDIFAKDHISQLALARWTSGYVIWAPDKIIGDKAIEISIDLKEQSVFHNIILVGKSSQVTVMEKITSKKDTTAVSLTKVLCDKSSCASVTHLNDHSNTTTSFANYVASLEKDAQAHFFTANFGGKLNRVKIDTHFSGEGAESTNNGVYVGKQQEHIDVTTNAHHHVPHTKNDMNINGIMKDNSSSIYRGLIKIDHEAPHTNSFLSNNVLKLSETSLAHNIPALEIDTNDVSASHGATIGDINEEELFYLKSRGLTQTQAEELIVTGFLEPIIDTIQNEHVKEHAREWIHHHG